MAEVLPASLAYLIATAIGAFFACIVLVLLASLANSTCALGHRGKRYVSTRALNLFDCGIGTHKFHNSPGLWTWLAKWKCEFCEKVGEDCLGDGHGWRVSSEGKLIVDPKVDCGTPPWKARADRELEQLAEKAKLEKWITKDDAYNLLRDAVEKAKPKPFHQCTDVNCKDTSHNP